MDGNKKEKKKIIFTADEQQKEGKRENPNKIMQSLYPEIS